jgi:hypothetical protein
MSHGEWKTQILLGYSTINSDAPMEHKTQLQRSDSYVRNNRGIVGSGVVCGSTPTMEEMLEMFSVGPHGSYIRRIETQASQSSNSLQADRSARVCCEIDPPLVELSPLLYVVA